ncbi:uncharacterized protein LOC131328317 [Rhododendron vialii]|uniref:uncharacterized protein LOC131328317 n=1 Tax=Rhododendron vialii TaxID=182163 RepID=UPI00265E3082|nr:uncharacterized protein LOC131328317 [Rhododendron vialii]
MVVHVPFLRWDKIPNPSPLSSTVGLYYLETAEGQQVIVAFVVRGAENRMVYQPFHEFLEDYHGVFNLGDVNEWNYGFQLNVWLDDLMYHSFVRYSEEAVDQCWYLKKLSMPDVTERLPRALCQYFPADGSSAWVVLRHGKKAWSVEIVSHEFRRNWNEFHQAHQLEVDHRIVFSCERKWIFHTAMFGKDGYELLFDWSGPAGRWQDLPPPSGNLHTACLPSILVDSHAVLKFIYFNVYGPDLRSEFNLRLRHVFGMLALEQMEIKMGSRTWIIPVQNLQVNIEAFNQFATALFVQCLNHVMICHAAYCVSLATKITSSFILNPQISESAALQSWCLANATKIKQLPPMTAMQALMVRSTAPPPTDAINVINLPTSVDKVRLINVKGIARVTNFNQRFHYLACSLCNKASNAYENDELWCNYCARRVPPLIRVKFNVQVSDPTASIAATIFPKIAEQFYGITGANIDTTEPDVPLSLELLDQLAEPKKCNVTLKAYMSTYAGISQCRFSVYSMSAIPEPTLDDHQNLQQPLALPPATPIKNEKSTATSASTHGAERNSDQPNAAFSLSKTTAAFDTLINLYNLSAYVDQPMLLTWFPEEMIWGGSLDSLDVLGAGFESPPLNSIPQHFANFSLNYDAKIGGPY